jgi:hypothetical protein
LLIEVWIVAVRVVDWPAICLRIESYWLLVFRNALFASKQPDQIQTNFLAAAPVAVGFVVHVYLSVPTLVVAFFFAHATPFEILVAECAAGAITAVEATSSAASATEVLRNILSSNNEFSENLNFQWSNLIGEKVNSR